MNPTALFSILVGIAFAGYGAWMIIREIRRVRRIQTWPSTAGKIVKSELDIDDDVDGTAYGVRVEYVYTVMGTSHTGAASIIGVATGDRERAEDLLGNYPAGRDLPVAYNPDCIWQSEVADLRQRDLKIGVIVMGLFLIGASILCTLGSIR